MSKLSLVLGAVFAVGAFQAPALACRCTQPSEANAYQRADAVARVRVEAATAPSADGTITAQAQVQEAWKRSLPPSIRVVTGDDCALPLVTGREYVLYLTAGDGVFGTNRCQRNRELVAGSDVPKWLRQHGRKF
jgi:hypothetical protein